MSRRQVHARMLSLVSAMREDGQVRFAIKLVKEAKIIRYCPYHQAFDGLEPLPA